MVGFQHCHCGKDALAFVLISNIPFAALWNRGWKPEAWVCGGMAALSF